MLRKATLKDVRRIQKLINFYAKKDEMLPRSLSELYENIRDFFVYEQRGKLCGCVALHISWEDLAEVKSLAVKKSYHGKGIGTKLLSACIKEAKKLKVGRIFALTYSPGFFRKFDFIQVDRSRLPHKIWSECIRCPYFPDCKEVALVKEL